MHNEHGVTLIELIAVVAILGILSCICVPCFGGFYYRLQEILLDTASKELLTDMRLVQQKASSEGYIYKIYFNKIENSYMIYSYKDMDNCIYKNVHLPAGISFDGTRSTYEDNMISFNSKGKPMPHPCTISLKNSLGQYKSITITVGTDYISIKN